MEHEVLTIDARMLLSSGIGTYLQNMLKRIRFEQLGVGVHIYVHTEEAAAWIRQYQPGATVKFCPHWIYGHREQFFWLKHLHGGLFWSPHYNIPWQGYEKLIVTVHDCFHLTPMAHPLLQLYARAMFGRIRKKADAILTVSEFSKRELQSQAKILDTPIYTIPNGVDPNWFTRAASLDATTQAKREIILHGKPYDFPYIVYVGNFKPHKNLFRLLKAYQRVNPDQKLICVGPFKNLKNRDERAYRLLQKMSGKVVSTDTVDNETLRNIVKHSDGLVFPSLYEGFGLPPLEAMASKVPTLVSDSASLPEICGKSPIYCDPTSIESIADGLRQLIALKDPEKSARIAEGYEHAAQFNWDASAKSAFEVFKSVLA